jgi:hypothetical protein
MESSATVKYSQADLMRDEGELDAGETGLETTHGKSDSIPTEQFCALEYVPQLKPAKRTIKQVVLIVVRQADGCLRFLAHPNLHQVVEATNLAYVISLFEEFLVCAKHHADQLFRHLCSLDSGPLLPWKVGEKIEEHPEIRELATQFMPL